MLDMTTAAKTLDIDSKKAELEREAEGAAAEMSKAISRMGEAIRRHGEGSKQAKGFEDEADAAFDRGEEIASKLLALETEVAVARAA